MKIKNLLLLVLIGFLISPFKGRAQAANAQDSLALIDLYNSTEGHNWTNHTNWLTKAPLSTWYGITLDATGRVIVLNLFAVGSTGTSNNLNGTLPVSLGSLANLTSLNLNYNQLIGNIPVTLGNLSKLTYLDLGHNHLNGSIPASLGKLNKLTYLDLGLNQLSGTIPDSLGLLSALTSFYLKYNQLSGTIPSSLGYLSNALTLDFSYNQLSGFIPSSFTQFYQNYIYLQNNQFTLASFDSLTYLGNFEIYPQKNIPIVKTGNSLSVSAGGVLANNIYNWYLNNSLVATIQGDSTFTATSPGNYSVAVSNTSNPIASNTAGLFGVEAANQIDSLALVDLYNNTDGTAWLNKTNWLTSAPLSTWYGVYLGINGKVTQLALVNNNLSGSLPSSLGDLSELNDLELIGNNFVGGIPVSFGNLTQLKILHLVSDNLSDSIPSSLSNLTQLTDLNLSCNKFSGEIPSSLDNFPNIIYLTLSSNQLSGEIPSSLSNLSKTLLALELQGNKLTGNIPSSFSNFHLFLFAVNNNQLGGAIPLANYPASVDSISLQNNRFTFNGMESEVTTYPNKVMYAPQATIPFYQKGSTLFVSAGGTPANDTFRLYKNGTLQTTQIADSIFVLSNKGKYNITVTNSVAKQLTLYSDTLFNSDSLILPAKPATEYASYEYTDTLGWTHYYYDNNTPNDLTDDTLLLSLKKNGQDIGTIGDGTFAVKLVATAGAGSNTGLHVTNPLITNTSGYWVMNRYWQVTPTHEPTASVGVRFYYNNQDLKDVNGSYPKHNLTNNKLIFYKAVGGNPDPTTNLAGATNIISILPGTVASDTSWTYHALSDTTQYGEYSVASFSGGGGGGTGNNYALPVVLINFTAGLLKNDAQLKWQISQEVNTGNYTVERSLTGTGFTAIGTVEAAGNSTITQSYKFTDYNAALLNTATLYYRLKITDKDDNFTYSKVIKLDIGGANAFVVYPNPAQNTATIAFTATAAGKYAIEITDLAGKTVKVIEGTSAMGANTATIDVVNYAQGTYIVKIEGDYVSKQSLKLVKQ